MNNDYNQRILIDTEALLWKKTMDDGVYKKLLSQDGIKETALLKMEANTSFRKDREINSVEILVVDGVYINELGSFEKGTYLSIPKEKQEFVTTNTGCVVFRKTNQSDNKEQIVVNASSIEWKPGQGNLEVMPLNIGTALVKWPKNEKFISHKHWGGEEVFVLKGTFIDEYGEYPTGSWIRSPHLSQHHPYVVEETIIFVKTGHL